MTLEDVTKGICCVSYLSKLEHGTIIPKQYVLREVVERLELNENKIRSKNEYIKMRKEKKYEYIEEPQEKIDEMIAKKDISEIFDELPVEIS